MSEALLVSVATVPNAGGEAWSGSASTTRVHPALDEYLRERGKAGRDDILEGLTYLIQEVRQRYTPGGIDSPEQSRMKMSRMLQESADTILGLQHDRDLETKRADMNEARFVENSKALRGIQDERVMARDDVWADEAACTRATLDQANKRADRAEKLAGIRGDKLDAVRALLRGVDR